MTNWERCNYLEPHGMHGDRNGIMCPGLARMVRKRLGDGPLMYWMEEMAPGIIYDTGRRTIEREEEEDG